jgi:CubicO group peptidase (beta-lactamase class C family)
VLKASYQITAGHQAGGYTAVSRLLVNALADGVPPAAAIEVTTAAGGTSYTAAGGWAVLGAGSAPSVPASLRTLFDIASLTKVVVTAPVALLLHQRKAWDIDDPIARWLPDAPASAVTIRQCLTHTAGLVPHRPFYAEQDSPAAIRQAAIAELADAAGGPVCYSDLSYMLVGWAAEQCAGEPLDVLAGREILGPLGMTSTCYRPSAPLPSIAATEADGDQRQSRGLIWGEVHDGNAYALGGVSGHAGLFSTAADLGRFAGALLRPDHHPVLSAATIELMTSRQAGAGDDVRAIGWRLRPGAWGRWPAGTIWHTGFTGTSLLVAPALGAAVVLLTNAVHPARHPAQIAALRAAVHRAVRAALAPAKTSRRACEWTSIPLSGSPTDPSAGALGWSGPARTSGRSSPWCGTTKATPPRPPATWRFRSASSRPPSPTTAPTPARSTT